MYVCMSLCVNCWKQKTILFKTVLLPSMLVCVFVLCLQTWGPLACPLRVFFGILVSKVVVVCGVCCSVVFTPVFIHSFLLHKTTLYYFFFLSFFLILCCSNFSHLTINRFSHFFFMFIVIVIIDPHCFLFLNI